MRARLTYLLLIAGAALAAAIYFYRLYRENAAGRVVERKVRDEATRAYGVERETIQRDIKAAEEELRRRTTAAESAVAAWESKLKKARSLRNSWRKGG